MFNIQFKNPGWINHQLFEYHSIEEVPQSVFSEIRKRLNAITSNSPEVSICIAAWNEELNIIRCLDSLSQTKLNVPFEILVVNNNSTDRTQKVLDLLGAQNYFQPIQGCGAAREMSQKKAAGKYILLGDADCLYPENWAQALLDELKKDGVVAVYGKHSFLGDQNIARWKYGLYEIGKRAVAAVRHFKYPYLNAYGMSLGYIRELGLKIGFDMRNIRGEDGRLCFDLMQYGKIHAVRKPSSVVWTVERNFNNDGGFQSALTKRLLIEMRRFKNYFKSPAWHDTKSSENTKAPEGWSKK